MPGTNFPAWGAPGDSDTHGCQTVMTYWPGSDNSTNSLFEPHTIIGGTSRRQVGSFLSNNNSGVDRTWLSRVTDDASGAAALMAANYAALIGRWDEYVKFTEGRAIFDGPDLQYYKLFKAMR